MAFTLDFTGEAVNTILTNANTDHETLATTIATLSALQSDVSVASASITTLQGRMDAAESSITDLSIATAALQSSISSINGWITTANSSFSAQTTDLATLSAIVIDNTLTIANPSYYVQIAKDSSGEHLYSRFYNFDSLPTALSTDAQLSDVITALNAVISALMEPQSY